MHCNKSEGGAELRCGILLTKLKEGMKPVTEIGKFTGGFEVISYKFRNALFGAKCFLLPLQTPISLSGQRLDLYDLFQRHFPDDLQFLSLVL